VAGGDLRRTSRLVVHAALFCVATLFSANYVISKLGMRELAPLSFAWLRVAAAAILLSLLGGWRGTTLDAADRRRVALYAILGVVINTTLFLSGLALTSVQVAAVLIGTIPPFALGAAIALGRERGTATKIGGIALAGAGALLVVGGESFHGTRHSLLGALMIVANCLSYALYLVLSKPLMARVSARALVTRMFSIGSLLMLPILRHAESSLVAVYTYVQPVLATILGAIVLGESLRPIVLAAAAMIFTGVWLAGRRLVP
jgi:drug/metabolite transporter (DMT)-like permease